jgi:hypothetical protein
LFVKKTEEKKTVRFAAIAATLVLGSALAFFLGARAGASLSHQTRAVTVGHAPVPAVQVANK